jgi:hypothetical protein
MYLALVQGDLVPAVTFTDISNCLDVPHSAFALPDKDPGEYVRMSIEVRAMVFSGTES